MLSPWGMAAWRQAAKELTAEACADRSGIAIFAIALGNETRRARWLVDDCDWHAAHSFYSAGITVVRASHRGASKMFSPSAAKGPTASKPLLPPSLSSPPSPQPEAPSSSPSPPCAQRGAPGLLSPVDTVTVRNTSELRYQLQQAASGGSLTLRLPRDAHFALDGHELLVDSGMDIGLHASPPGALLDAGGLSRVVAVRRGGRLALRGVHLFGGHVHQVTGDASGGCVFVGNGSSLNLAEGSVTRCSLVNSHGAVNGGGVFVDSTAKVRVRAAYLCQRCCCVDSVHKLFI